MFQIDNPCASKTGTVYNNRQIDTNDCLIDRYNTLTYTPLIYPNK